MADTTIPQDAIPCLDKGFVRLVDSMGNDDAIVQAARVSYGKGTKKVTQDRGLIRYLMRHRHTTPFEMVEFKFHCKMPIFVARQWVRHRTANINEYSLRYSEAQSDFYIPAEKDIHFQSALNKQGRAAAEVPAELKAKVIQYFQETSQKSFALYQELNEAGIARELARAILPVNIYTEWYWKNDLHNILHFLHLRIDAHAQYEIRVYAEAMARYVKEIVPIAYEAFEDYVLRGMCFTGTEQAIFRRNLPKSIREEIREDIIFRIVATKGKGRDLSDEEWWDIYQKNGGSEAFDDFILKWYSGATEPGNVRELTEFKEKLDTIFPS